MIFSHAPAGFLVALVTKKLWDKGLTKRQTLWIFIIGTFSALVPDIDVIYFYLLKAEMTHRELFTHSFILYIVISLIIFLIGYLLKKQFIKAIAIVFFFSTLSHLILDSMTAGVPWLYPINNFLYGFLSIPFLNNGFYGQNLFVFTLSTEVLIFLLLFNVIIFIKSKNNIVKILATVFSIIIFIIIIVSLLMFSKSMYVRNSDYYFSDLDNDMIINMRDNDMDGDGENNLTDPDANNNDIGNIEDINEEANSMVGAWYDWTEKGYWGLLSRFGTLSNMDVILKAYDSAGTYFGAELKKDFQNNPENYYNTPDDHLFKNNPENLYAFCENGEYLIDTNERPRRGDIVFYGSNDRIRHVSLVSDVTCSSVLVIDGGLYSKVDKANSDEVKEKFGNVMGYCRILDK